MVFAKGSRRISVRVFLYDVHANTVIYLPLLLWKSFTYMCLLSYASASIQIIVETSTRVNVFHYWLCHTHIQIKNLLCELLFIPLENRKRIDGIYHGLLAGTVETNIWDSGWAVLTTVIKHPRMHATGSRGYQRI